MTFYEYISIGWGVTVITAYFIGRSKMWKDSDTAERVMLSVYVTSSIVLWPISGAIGIVWGLLTLVEKASNGRSTY